MMSLSRLLPVSVLFVATSLLAAGGLTACADDDGAAEGAAVDPADEGFEAQPYYASETLFINERSHGNVIRHLILHDAVDGVAPGFDLDGKNSGADDDETCGHPDLKDPDGTEGVDNQLSALWGQIGPLVGEATQALIQGAINEGRLLLMIELVGVDDLVNDDSVEVHLFRGALDPEIGTLGYLAPDQTYEVDYAEPASSVLDVAIVDGVVHAGPVEFSVPIDILDANFLFNVHDGQLRFTIEEDGTLTGTLGGSVVLAEFLGDLYETNAAAEAHLVTPIFESAADLDKGPDGNCRQFSIAVGFEATTAFVVRDSEFEDGPAAP